MYGDQSEEFGCGSWGLKSYVTITTTEMRTSKNQLRIWFRLEKQQICTCLTLFLHFFAVNTRPRFAGYHQIPTA